MTTPPEPPREPEPPQVPEPPREPEPPPGLFSGTPANRTDGAVPVDETPSWYSGATGAPPAGGYAVPGWSAPPPGITPSNDPLVPHDFSSLFDRLGGILKRSWRSLLVIQVLGTLLPTALMLAVVYGSGLGSVVYANQASVGAAPPMTEEELAELLNLLLGVGIIVVLIALVTAFIGAAATAASIWTVTRQAAGQPAPLGDAFRYGFGRALPLFGWNLLSGLCIGIGALCCILPGVYLGVALSLIAPIVVFEGGNAFSRSFGLTHSRFWPTAGRVLLLYVAYLGFTFVVGLPNNIVSVPMDSPVVQLVLAGVVQLVTTALAMPASIVLLAGLTLIYTEVRSHERPLSTPELVAELDRP